MSSGFVLLCNRVASHGSRSNDIPLSAAVSHPPLNDSSYYNSERRRPLLNSVGVESTIRAFIKTLFYIPTPLRILQIYETLL